MPVSKILMNKQVAAGDVLCDIETDKATLDFETLEDGYEFEIFKESLSGCA